MKSNEVSLAKLSERIDNHEEENKESGDEFDPSQAQEINIDEESVTFTERLEDIKGLLIFINL
jgi:hypothetical protein